MGPTLKELIAQGRQLENRDLLGGYRAYEVWHEDCLEFLEYLQVAFREEVRTPNDIGKGITWLEKTFRQD